MTTNAKAYIQALTWCNPNERLMMDALLRHRPLCVNPDDDACLLTAHPQLRIIPQHQSKRTHKYRLDFAVILSVKGVATIKVDVECDGHGFHKLTKQQVAADNRRNRRLSELGWLVERFSGSEVWLTPDECAKRVYRALDDEFAKLVQTQAEAQWNVAA